MCAGIDAGGPARGDVGEALLGVAVAELMGEICWVCELKRVNCEGDAVNCGTGITNSDVIAVMGFCGELSLSWIVEEVGRRTGWFGFSRNIQVESGIRRREISCVGEPTFLPEKRRQCNNGLSAVSSQSRTHDADIVGLFAHFGRTALRWYKGRGQHWRRPGPRS